MAASAAPKKPARTKTRPALPVNLARTLIRGHPAPMIGQKKLRIHQRPIREKIVGFTGHDLPTLTDG